MLHGFRRAVFRTSLVSTAAVAAAVALAAPASACGGLVGENGTIKLTRTTTLAAYHDGVERYVTSFEFSGQGKEVGSIVPLPGVPTKVERGGSWTLQRLEREVTPIRHAAEFGLEKSAAAADSAQVLYQTQIDALDITILKGGGSEVGKWAVDHGFLLTPDAPAMLDFYGRRSPIFMAARFDATRATALSQNSGDGTPIMLTIPVKQPWVPLHILSLGLDKAAVVDADVFLLTDVQPKLLAGGTGLSLERNEPASSALLDDLRSDKNMDWVPQDMWFTYLRLHTNARTLGYDLAVAATPHSVPRLVDTGVSASAAHPVTPRSKGYTIWPLVLAVIAAAIAYAATSLPRRPRRAGAPFAGLPSAGQPS